MGTKMAIKTILSVLIMASPSLARAQSVSLSVEGVLAAACELRDLPTGVQSLGEITVAGSKEVNFTVDCNALLAMRLLRKT